MADLSDLVILAVEEVVELSEVREHIGSIESVIGDADMYLAWLSLAARNKNNQ